MRTRALASVKPISGRLYVSADMGTWFISVGSMVRANSGEVGARVPGARDWDGFDASSLDEPGVGVC